MPQISVSADDSSSVSLTTATTATTTESSSATPPRKLSKRKKKKKAQIAAASRSYDPPPQYQAKGNVKITRNQTQNVIPNRIQERFSDLYQYMNKALAFNTADPIDDDLKYDDEVRVLNYDFHDQQTGEELYSVIKAHSERGFKWAMLPQLFTEKEIYATYGISAQRLPRIARIALNMTKSCKNKLSVQQRCVSIEQTKWSKVTVFSPQRDKNKKRRTTLSLIQSEFIALCVDSVQKQSENEAELIPIIMFNASKNQHWIEYVQVIRLVERVDIGLSFVYDTCSKDVRVTGVHVDKWALLRQHELLLPHHAKECRCFDAFEANIDDLKIGNLDQELRTIKDLKRTIDEWKALDPDMDESKSLPSTASIQMSPSSQIDSSSASQ